MCLCECYYHLMFYNVDIQQKSFLAGVSVCRFVFISQVSGQTPLQDTKPSELVGQRSTDRDLLTEICWQLWRCDGRKWCGLTVSLRDNQNNEIKAGLTSGHATHKYCLSTGSSQKVYAPHEMNIQRAQKIYKPEENCG